MIGFGIATVFAVGFAEVEEEVPPLQHYTDYDAIQAETCLTPYEDQIVSYHNTIAHQFISIPAWIDQVGDHLITEFFPEELTFNLTNTTLSGGNVTINGTDIVNAEIVITSATVTGMNSYYDKAIKRAGGSRYTTTVEYYPKGVHFLLNAVVTVNGTEELTMVIGVKAGPKEENLEKPLEEMTFKDFKTVYASDNGENEDAENLECEKHVGVRFNLLVALDAERMCEIYGPAFFSSIDCFLYGTYYAEDCPGVAFTSMQIGLSGVSLEVVSYSLHENVTNEVAVPAELNEALENSDLPDQLADGLSVGLTEYLNGQIMENYANMSDCAFAQELPGYPIVTPETPAPIPVSGDRAPMEPTLTAYHFPFEHMEIYPLVDVSQVCIVNNGGFALKWMFRHCATETNSGSTKIYPADITVCKDVSDLDVVAEGDIVRAGVKVVAGRSAVMPATMKYMPNSNAAGFMCSGSTMIPQCQFVSLIPVDPTVPIPASRICVINHGGFAMKFSAWDVTVGSVKYTDAYPINQKKCIDLTALPVPLSNTATQYKLKVFVVGGMHKTFNRMHVASTNGLSATWQCKGSSMNLRCNLLANQNTEDQEASSKSMSTSAA